VTGGGGGGEEALSFGELPYSPNSDCDTTHRHNYKTKTSS